MRVTATEAKNRFGSLCAQAKREPVFVEKAGQLDTVILSAEQYQALKANQDKASRVARKKAFEAEYGEPKNSSYPGAASVGGGVGRPICPTMRWQM